MTALPITQLQAELRNLKSASKASNKMQAFHYGLLHDCIMYTQVLSVDQLGLIRRLKDKVNDKSSQASYEELQYILKSAGLSTTMRRD